MASEPTGEPEADDDWWRDRHDRRFVEIVDLLQSVVDTQSSILKRVEALEQRLAKLTNETDDDWWKGSDNDE